MGSARLLWQVSHKKIPHKHAEGKPMPSPLRTRRFPQGFHTCRVTIKKEGPSAAAEVALGELRLYQNGDEKVHAYRGGRV